MENKEISCACGCRELNNCVAVSVAVGSNEEGWTEFALLTREGGMLGTCTSLCSCYTRRSFASSRGEDGGESPMESTGNVNVKCCYRLARERVECGG